MTAKDKFLLSYAAKPFAEMVSKPEFEAALDAAIMESMQQLGGTDNTEEAAAKHWRLEGVALLSRNLVKIATPDAQPVVEQWGHLKGNV